MILEKLIKETFSKNMTVEKAEIKQNKYAEKLHELRTYSPRVFKYIDLKESVSKNVKNFMTDGKNCLWVLKWNITAS